IYNTGIYMGKASALTVGTVTITAALGDATAGTATLHVVDKSLVSITLTPIGVTLESGQSLQFIAWGLSDDGSSEAITASVEWEAIYDGAVPIVIVGNIGGGKGLVTAVAPGDAIIRATLGDVSGEMGVIVILP
ncbi:MAG: Ig-like domain-containing protein, partial [Thiotrichaceae bacterium]|nr:Ig-like domain-containing protein [Thiotrichaceae bacterium]